MTGGASPQHAADPQSGWNRPSPEQAAWSRRRALRDRIFLVACCIVAAMTVGVLAVLLGSIVRAGIRHLDWQFLTAPASTRSAAAAGIGPALWGTISACIVTAVVTLPLGVATAIFLEEFKPKRAWALRAHSFIALNIRNLAGVPSIVYGLLGLTLFVQMFGVFGNENSPSVEVNASYSDAFMDEAGNALFIPVDDRDAPLAAVTEGMTAFMNIGAGEPPAEVVVRIVPAEKLWASPDLLTADGAPRPGVISREMVEAAPVFRNVDRTSVGYFRLPFGRSVLAGGLTLALVVLPVIIIASQESLRAVPNSLREGALAAGATRWQMVRRMTLPASVPGIMTGSILAMSRAIGEAAPILVIAGIVYITFNPTNLMSGFTVMPLQIYYWAGEARQEFHEIAATGIIVLLAILLTFNAVAVVIRQKFQRPLQ